MDDLRGAREAEVAELILEGRTSRRIGAELAISERADQAAR